MAISKFNNIMKIMNFTLIERTKPAKEIFPLCI